MAVGTYVGTLFSEATGFVLPGYVGAMFVAVLVRNIMDKFKPEAINMKSISLIGDVTLGVFLSMALMSIKLWEIADLALPLFIIVFAQVFFIVVFSIFVLFKLLGKNYDAAVMVAGFAGHGLGATPNAMANMSAVVQRFGPSKKAFLVVPIVGAFLIVGIIEAMDFNQKVDMVTIGYYLAEASWGKGIASEAVATIVKFLLEEVNVNRIQAEVMPLNEPSKKVLLKNGFLKEGLLRQASLWSGKGVIDLEIYGLLKGDYNLKD